MPTMWNRMMTVFVCGLLVGPDSAEAQTPSDSVAVVDVVMRYVTGWREGDTEALADVFALTDGVVLWTSGNDGAAQLNGMTFQQIVDRGRRPNPSYGLETTIEEIDVVDGKLAVARVHISRSGGSYTDVFVLYKLEQGWRIVTKTYVTR